MKKVYQTIVDPGKGNCMQAAIASLLNLDLEEVPDFKAMGDKWHTEMFNFLRKKGYDMLGTLYNPRHQAADSYDWYVEMSKEKGEPALLPHNRFNELKDMEGVDGYFFATVFSPKYYDPMSVKQITHAVIIDQFFNIVNPVNEGYEGMKKFPLHDLIGYNGVINLFMIEPLKDK